jgi:hypothetical protein
MEHRPFAVFLHSFSFLQSVTVSALQKNRSDADKAERQKILKIYIIFMLQFTIPAVMCASGSICCGTPFITHVYRRKELNPGTDLSVTVQGTYLDLRDME